jgi:hypothetical protein
MMPVLAVQIADVVGLVLFVPLVIGLTFFLFRSWERGRS